MTSLKEYTDCLETLEKRLSPRYGVTGNYPKRSDTVSLRDCDKQRNEYQFRHSIPWSHFKTIKYDEWSAFFRLLGDCATVTFQLGMLDSKPIDSDTMVLKFLTETTEDMDKGVVDPNQSVMVEIILKKERLLEKAFNKNFPELTDSVRIHWYLNEVDAKRSFTAPLPKLAEWFEDGKRVVVIVPLSNCQFEGNWLSILSVDTPLQEIKERIEKKVDPAETERLAKRQKKRAKVVRGIEGWTKFMPDHLRIKEISVSTPSKDALHPLIVPLLGSAIHLIFASLATAVDPKSEPAASDSWVASFEGLKEARVKVCNTPPSDIPALLWERYMRWDDIYEAVYQFDRTDEYLAILRQLLVMALQDDPALNYQMLYEGKGNRDLLTDLKEQYRLFMGESVDKYFKNLKDITAYFQSRIDALNKQISELLEGLLKNLLALFGVATGTIIIKAVDAGERSLPLLRWFVFAFVCFVAVVTIVYYSASWWSYRLTSREFDTNVQSVEKFFANADILSQIKEPFGKRRKLFRTIFGLTLLIYFALIGVGVFSFMALTKQEQVQSAAAKRANPSSPTSATPIPSTAIAPRETVNAASKSPDVTPKAVLNTSQTAPSGTGENVPSPTLPSSSSSSSSSTTNPPDTSHRPASAEGESTKGQKPIPSSTGTNKAASKGTTPTATTPTATAPKTKPEDSTTLPVIPPH